MKYKYTDGAIRFAAGTCFDPVKIFECGQCFRWNQDKGGYTGIAMNRRLRVQNEGGEISMDCAPWEFEEIWRDYFDMDTDYDHIRETVSIDPYMKEAAEYGAGIRILRQDSWEALCSFIISQCNNIPRIKGIVERLCRDFGEKKGTGEEVFYTFPRPGIIARLREDDLTSIRAGFRASYIISAARAVDSGELDLQALKKGSADEALKALKGLNGVGDKVAGCVMLFGLYKTEAFPIDVWMKRAISRHYGANFSPDIFGRYAGIAQQYMFYYARSGERTA